MAKQVQLRRGTTAELSSVTGAAGEVIVDTTKDTLTVHDAYTAGGIPLLREDVDNLADNSVNINKLTIGSASQVLTTNSAGTALEWGYANNASALTAGTLSTDRMAEGTVINMETYEFTSRISTTQSSSFQNYFTSTYNKVSASSRVVVMVTLAQHGERNGSGTSRFVLGNQTKYGQHSYGNTAHTKSVPHAFYFGSNTQTGSLSWSFGSDNAGGQIVNPNTSDDSRLNQGQGSIVTIWEYL